jgi:uncharacterized protein YmfQ (DUF2313 family)
MTTCDNPTTDAFFCPDQPAWYDTLVASLPRGRAWLTAATASGMPVQSGFWQAVAAAFASLDQRACALLNEFFCATMSETSDLWMADYYGLADTCDPYPDLCAKVAALGGSDCAYFSEVAANAGWSIQCVDGLDECGGFAGGIYADGFVAAGVPQPATLAIGVDMVTSPALASYTPANNHADGMFADSFLACGPSLAPLECVLARVLPAHAAVAFAIFYSDSLDFSVARNSGYRAYFF